MPIRTHERSAVGAGYTELPHGERPPARLEHAIDVGSFNSRSRMGSEYHSVTSIALYRFRLLHQKINEAADFRAEVTAVGVGDVQGDAA